MLRTSIVLLTIFASAWTAISARAETRVALVVGIGAYANAPKLTNPPNDAHDMAAALKGAGFDVIEAIDATKSELDAALRGFAEKLTTADVALFYYAGHGLQVGAQNYLLPTDAKLGQERDLEFEAMKLDFVLRQLEIDREGKTTIVVLDACRDNPFVPNLARSMGTRSASIGRGLAAAAAGLGTFISFSTQPGNVALDGDGRNSPFAKALTKHLGAKGRNLQATMIAVRKEVVAATQGKQVPWDHSAMTGDFYFVPGDAAPAAGSVSPPPASTSADVAALQERLAKLEAEAKARANAPQTNVLPESMMKLAELRARAASLEDLVKDLQRKLMDTRMQEGKAQNPDEKAKLTRDAINIQMEWTRRGLDLKKLKEEIAALEGAKQPAVASPAANLPVIPARPKTSPDAFAVTENVSLSGTEIKSFRAQSPAACREACEQEKTCAGYQHGRKIPVMGQCHLFSAVTERREDRQWISGVKKEDVASPAP